MALEGRSNNLTAGYDSLSEDINKVDQKDSIEEGATETPIDEADVKLSDDELIELKKQWESEWTAGTTSLKQRRDQNEKYWLGKQQPNNVEYAESDRPIVDNLIFEALETFLPIATRQNPEAVVSADATPDGISLAKKVEKMLINWADITRLKLKLKQATRHWALYYQGVIKVGWSELENEITAKVVRPQNLILDPKSTVEEAEYTGEYIGEVREDKAGNLKLRFPDMKDTIEIESKGKDGTRIKYIEWWTDEVVFWTLKDKVLGKSRNPHYIFPDEVEEEVQIDEFGAEVEVSEEEKAPLNHFNRPKKPYIFLSVFNTGKRPYDDTSLIEQNLSNQDIINRRIEQIDTNANNTNGGIVVSGDAFTKEEAAKVSNALRKGGTVWVPAGEPKASVDKFTGAALPQYIYQQLLDVRSELRNIFGVKGSSAQGIESVDTVRGKIIAKGSDDSRIGGGVSEYLEQMADGVYNWVVQLMYIYYDQTHVASVIGDERAQELIEIRRGDLNRKLRVSVKEGSMIPKDSLTQRNEAIDLWGAGAIDPITLLERLDFPNPRESAEKAFTWQSNPGALFGGGQQPQGQPGAEGGIPPELAALLGGGGQPPAPTDLAQGQQGADILGNVPIQ